MPYLQLDVPRTYPTAVKRALAGDMGAVYARIMQADVARISVAIRELGDGGLWRCTTGEPRPAALLMCDIRRGRPADQRAELARALIATCTQHLDLPETDINVEFTQHAGDEMYHPTLGGFGDDWSEPSSST